MGTHAVRSLTVAVQWSAAARKVVKLDGLPSNDARNPTHSLATVGGAAASVMDSESDFPDPFMDRNRSLPVCSCDEYFGQRDRLSPGTLSNLPQSCGRRGYGASAPARRRDRAAGGAGIHDL